MLGAGVAGLQAIATARRLGAVVTAFDVRAGGQGAGQSLGAKFLEIEGIGDAAGEGGYARELSPRSSAPQQQALQRRRSPSSDVVITTALIPGRPAPKLVTADAVADMRPAR